MSVRTRFAPSPTGSLHVGGVRTALFCLLHARRHGGRFLLRIEDTDRARSTEEAAEGILRDLRWLGLQWDEGPGAEQAGTGPYFQAQRLDLYNAVIDQLLASGHAYEAWDTHAELDAERAIASAAKLNFRYVRKVLDADTIAAYRAAGRTPVVRLAAPRHDLHVEDEILGQVTQTADELDDIVIRKADGFPTYHFAVVIDDYKMGVSLVLRGQEHLMNTHKHLGIYEALNWAPPKYAHLPLIANPDNTKMSKRDKAKTSREAARRAQVERKGDPKDWSWLAEATGRTVDDLAGFMAKQHDSIATAEAIAAFLKVKLPMIEVMDFRKGGYLPEALINYMALLGWSPGDDREVLPFDQMVAAWDLTRVNKTQAKFDAEKLAWMNGEYIKKVDLDTLTVAHTSYLDVAPTSPFAGMPAERRRAFLALYQPRIATFAELDEAARFFFVRPSTWDAKAVQKHLLADGGLERLALIRDALAALPEWSATDIQLTLDGLAASHDVKLGQIAQPLRVALTGTAVSPQIHDTLALLGRTESLDRLKAALSTHAR